MLLERAVARFAARIVDRHPCGDHMLFIGEVDACAHRHVPPLLWQGGRYRGSHPDDGHD